MAKRLLIMILTLAMILPVTSCSDKYAVKYNSTYITEGMYRYLYGSLKHHYLETYEDIEDSDEGWNEMVSEEMTYAEYVDNKIRETIDVFVVSAELYDSYGYTVNSEGQATITAEIEKAVDHFGSEEKLIEALNEYDMTVADLRRAHEIQYKYERLLYDSGTVKVDDDDREAYYREKYILVKLIFISTKNGYTLDENGKVKETFLLSDAQKQDKIKAADELEQRIASGELTFEDAYLDGKINEFDTAGYPNGIYFGRDSYTATGLTDIAEKGFNLQVGQMARHSDDNGEFLICRYDLPALAYKAEADYAQFSDMDENCAKAKFDRRMSELIPTVEVSKGLYDKYTVMNITPISY